MEIRLRIYKSEIMKAAKDETYLSGRSVLAADGSNTEVVYNMQAGDDSVHESKLLRSLRVGLDSLKSQLTNFVKNDGERTGDNISDTMVADHDYFDIVLNVSERFNKGYVSSLASMSSAYIIDYTIATWWTAVNPSLAANYYNSAGAVLGNIRRCFIKVSPISPAYKYPRGIENGAYYENGEELVIGRPYPAPYSVYGENEDDTDVVDDVLIESSNPAYIKVDGTVGNYTITRLAPYGLSTIRLYSKHDPSVEGGWAIENWPASANQEV